MLFAGYCSQLAVDFDAYLHQRISVQRRQCSYERFVSFISRSLHHVFIIPPRFALN